MPASIKLSDSEPTIGEAHLVLNNPPPPSPFISPLTELVDLRRAFAELTASHETLLGTVIGLQVKVAALESRTWWSMLKAQVKSWLQGAA